QLRIDAVDAVGFGETLPIVEVQWLPERFLVAASEPGPYLLAVGNDSSDLKPSPALDTRSVLPLDDAPAMHVPVAALVEGPLPEGAAEQKPQRIAQAASWSRYVLWGVLLAAVLALGTMALRIATQLKRARTEDAGPDRPAAS